MWTEPSPAEELAEAIKRVLDDRCLMRDYSAEVKEFNKKGWDKTEETHKRKEELFTMLREKSSELSPSELRKIMEEINKL